MWTLTHIAEVVNHQRDSVEEIPVSGAYKDFKYLLSLPFSVFGFLRGRISFIVYEELGVCWCNKLST